MLDTNKQFDAVVETCREIYSKKLQDYGAAWRIMRPESITDQIFIKANRIRSIETTGINKVGEDIRSEFIGIVNYGIIGIIQMEKGYVDKVDFNVNQALSFYDDKMKEVRLLMLKKNHDYDEAWRGMRISSYTDLILSKLNRTKSIEDNKGKTLISEGIVANYQDMINYSIFGLIRIDFDEELDNVYRTSLPRECKANADCK